MLGEAQRMLGEFQLILGEAPQRPAAGDLGAIRDDVLHWICSGRTSNDLGHWICSERGSADPSQVFLAGDDPGDFKFWLGRQPQRASLLSISNFLFALMV